ncbi:hypothetical protein CC1G_15383 [Coprinopsis cinerea okayama7|uniref:Uncharacterized protein n=1 Tax=Coprinopsis cinerea (strain Okayama-7 / 130 / ATCC MYA-4618 / FGSC 9003) TaxID=240176 RepID=D6RQR3_COPC7|nr:hypothetical protein CC1G_15383 [Coprinopsis cinerea okayama7\|eukprot:XP_002910105.1 hypothetical protein CC1G_15383 [Coprinopsis cinerea okayama7\
MQSTYSPAMQLTNRNLFQTFTSGVLVVLVLLVAQGAGAPLTQRTEFTAGALRVRSRVYNAAGALVARTSTLHRPARHVSQAQSRGDTALESQRGARPTPAAHLQELEARNMFGRIIDKVKDYVLPPSPAQAAVRPVKYGQTEYVMKTQQRYQEFLRKQEEARRKLEQQASAGGSGAQLKPRPQRADSVSSVASTDSGKTLVSRPATPKRQDTTGSIKRRSLSLLPRSWEFE